MWIVFLNWTYLIRLFIFILSLLLVLIFVYFGNGTRYYVSWWISPKVPKAVPKKCPGRIWYVNDKLIYAHLHRLPHAVFATFVLLVLNLRWVNDVCVHKLNYHWHTKYRRDIFVGHPVFWYVKSDIFTVSVQVRALHWAVL